MTVVGSEDEVKEYREDELEGVKIRGKGCPRPIKSWTQAGLNMKGMHFCIVEDHLHRTVNVSVLDIMRRLGYTKPFPIQAQAIPVIMSGRDCIGAAKTVMCLLCCHGKPSPLGRALGRLLHLYYRCSDMSWISLRSKLAMARSLSLWCAIYRC